MDSPRPTMQDVARAAGVHQTTVSRALRNDHRLPEATRTRIKALAEQLGYRSNPLVSALVVARRSRHPPAFEAVIGFIIREELDDPRPPERLLVARREYLRGAREAAARQGFKVEEFVVGSAGLSEERLDTVLGTRNIHGIILAPLQEAHGHYTLEWTRYCTVVIEYTFTEPEFDRVVHDSYDGMRRIMSECRRRGLRRVGLVMTTVGHERTERSNGAAYWIEQKSDAFFVEVPPLILPTWRAGAFAEWMERYRPEVVVTSNDILTPLQQWCGGQHLLPGRDLGIVNVNASNAGEVAGIFQNPAGIGATAVRMVIEKIMHNDWGVPERRQTVLTPGKWLDGQSLRSTLLAGAVADAGV